MDGVTLPAACRKVGKPKSWGERVFQEYKAELGEPTRIGIVRVWPCVVIEKLREIIAREERCGAGAR